MDSTNSPKAQDPVTKNAGSVVKATMNAAKATAGSAVKATTTAASGLFSGLFGSSAPAPVAPAAATTGGRRKIMRKSRKMSMKLTNRMSKSRRNKH